MSHNTANILIALYLFLFVGLLIGLSAGTSTAEVCATVPHL